MNHRSGAYGLSDAPYNSRTFRAAGHMSERILFLTGKLAAESADVCSYSFAKFLMDNRRFTAMISTLRKGGDFPKVFADVFGGSPEQLAAAWAGVPTKGGRGRAK